MSARGTPGRSDSESPASARNIPDFVAIHALQPGVPRAVPVLVGLGNMPLQ